MAGDNFIVAVFLTAFGRRIAEWQMEQHSWDMDAAVEIYNPGRRIGGRGWPRSVQIDAETLGTLFYDLSEEQAAGPGLYLVRTPLNG